MKNKGIVIFLVFLGVVIVGIIAGDFITSMPDKRPENPYELNMDPFTKVDTALIRYRESRNFRISFDKPAGICFKNNKIYIAGDKRLQIIDNSGKLISEISLEDYPTCINATADKILVGFKRTASVLSAEGNKIAGLNGFSDSTVITSLAEYAGNIFVADAGKRKVWRFDAEGKKLGEFEGKSSNSQIHGFIIPSPYFDLAINGEGELWVANPGKHALENYTPEGVLRTWWENQSVKIEGFSGCCNPAQFAFSPDGGFVTSEKGLVRIKKYKPSGEFDCVVAEPSKFEANGHAPEVAVDNEGNIYALDFDRRIIRLFVKK